MTLTRARDQDDPRDVDHPPLGLIFGTFMLAIMVGSALFRAAVVNGMAITRLLRYTLGVAAATMMLVFVDPLWQRNP